MKILHLPKISTAIIVVLSFCILSCTDIQKNDVHTAALAGGNKTKPLADKDLKFLLDVYASGLYKIELAQEAEIRSTSPQSVELARQVVEAHSETNAKIAEIISNNEMTLPADITEEQKETWKQMIKQKGWLFDKAFLDVLTSYHGTELAMLQNGAAEVKDVNIKSLANNGITNLEEEKGLIAELQPLVQQRVDIPAPENKTGKNN